MTTVLATPAPEVGWASGPLGAVQAADREISAATARRARAVAQFAASRPASADRPPGSPGAMSAERWVARADVLRPVSEWATQELAVALSVSSEAAQALLERSLTLVRRLPATLDALEAGRLHAGHLWCLLEHVAPIACDGVRTRLEADLLAWVAGRGGVTTPAQLADKVRREVLERAARSAAEGLVRAVRRRGVSARPDRTAGTSVVSALLTTPEAAALLAALGAYADALPADGRTRGQKMADCLLDLVLRPGRHGPPPVQVALTVVAPVGALLGGDQPCEVDGQVVPAEVVRALLAALTGTPLVPTTVTDTTPADTAGKGPAVHLRDPLEVPVDLVPPASVDPEFLRWWTATVRQVLAEDPAARGWPLVDLGAVEARWASDADPPEPHLSPASAEPARPSDPAATDDGGGWWATADRAVDDAGASVLAAQRALGHALRLVAAAERADAADDTAWADTPAGRVSAAPDALAALAVATDQARQELADLLARTAGGGLVDRPRIAVTDALTRALLTLTDLPALHRAAHDDTGLTVPRETRGYRPGAALDRHVRTRDRRCRFPGCRRPVPRGGELDHAVPWPAGPTAAANLTGYCTGHHRGKHQAPGWRHAMSAGGALTATTPSGLVATTQPPPF